MRFSHLFTLATALLAISSMGAWASTSSSENTLICPTTQKTNKTTENFLPYGRINFTPVLIGENKALGILGEIGPRNYRINGTYGLFYGEHHRFKIGGEYLGQKLRYRFLPFHERRWVQQYAVGGKYQYLLGCNGYREGYIQGVQVQGYYSQARGHSPRSVFCPNQNLTIFRHMAAGRQWNVEAGPILMPWRNAILIGTVGYDEFRFNRRFINKRHHFSGVSGAVYLNQRIRKQFAIDVKAEFRRAYNYLEGMLSWNSCFYKGEVTLGVFGSHTWGRMGLPSISTVGGEVRYAFGVENCGRCKCCHECEVCPAILADWVASPAVYTPQVFALAESSVCLGPTSTPFPLITGLGAAFDFPLGFSAVDLATNFTSTSGVPLTFSASNLPAGVTLKADGTLLVNNDGLNPGIFDITVTGTTECGTTSQVIPILLEGGA